MRHSSPKPKHSLPLKGTQEKQHSPPTAVQLDIVHVHGARHDKCGITVTHRYIPKIYICVCVLMGEAEHIPAIFFVTQHGGVLPIQPRLRDWSLFAGMICQIVTVSKKNRNALLASQNFRPPLVSAGKHSMIWRTSSQIYTSRQRNGRPKTANSPE